MPIFATVTREVQGEHVDFSSLADIAVWADAIGRIHAVSDSAFGVSIGPKQP